MWNKMQRGGMNLLDFGIKWWIRFIAFDFGLALGYEMHKALTSPHYDYYPTILSLLGAVLLWALFHYLFYRPVHKKQMALAKTGHAPSQPIPTEKAVYKFENDSSFVSRQLWRAYKWVGQLFERLEQSFGAKLTQNLYRKLQSQSIIKPTLQPTKLVAVLVCGIVLGIPAAFLTWAFWVESYNQVFSSFWQALGSALTVIAIIYFYVQYKFGVNLKPQVNDPNLKTFQVENGLLLTKVACPNVYRVLNNRAATLKSPPIDAIVLSEQFGFDVRRPKILGANTTLYISLATFDLLDRVAFETGLAAAYNRGRRGGLVGECLAMRLLAFFECHKNKLEQQAIVIEVISKDPINWAANLLSKIFCLTGAFMMLICYKSVGGLAGRISQRATYVADYKVSSLTGTAKMADFLDVLSYEIIYWHFMTSSPDLNPDTYASFGAYLNTLDEQVIYTGKGIYDQISARLTSQRPPITNRVELLNNHYTPVSAFEAIPQISNEDFALISQELNQFRAEIFERAKQYAQTLVKPD